MQEKSIDFSAFDKKTKRDYFLTSALLVVALLFGLTVKATFSSSTSLKIISGILLVLSTLFFGFYAYYLNNANIKRNIATLSEFAQDNGFEFSYDPVYSSNGIVFKVGNFDHHTEYFMNGVLDGYPIALFWHRFSTGGGRSNTKYYYGVIEISLPKDVPHIFIEEKFRGAFKDDALNIFKSQNLLELEGDFNKHFTVYAASGYQVEELTILNPAFMAAIEDQAERFHIELIDKKAYVYMPSDMNINKDKVAHLLSAGRFLIQQLQKEMDTFKFKPNVQVPDNMNASKLEQFIGM